MLVHVLLYEVGGEGEGIHSIDIKGKTIVIMFEDKDDAERYKGLLEAQDFPVPSIEALEQQEIVLFCEKAGYESRLVTKGFLPQNEEERLLISPPQSNLDVSLAENLDDVSSVTDDNQNLPDLENIRRQLENLI